MARRIQDWLTEIGLGEHLDAFVENAVGFELLPHLTNEDLKDLGIAKLGDRKTLLLAIERLGATDQPAAREASPPASGAAERRQLTVMFVDLVGSTALSARLDPEDMGEIIKTYQNSVAGVVTRFDGHIAKYMGDGVLCYFGWPRAHEDDAERAVRAGLSIMEAMAAMRAPDGEKLAARVGIATGLVVVGDLVGEGAAQEEAVVGETPNLAARLQAVAAPGQVVLAETTRRLLGEIFEVVDLGGKRLAGFAAEVRVFGAEGERIVESRFAARRARDLSPMVGRRQELALLLDRWHQATSGEGQMVLLTGEAGIGKSRIVQSLVDRLSAEDHIRINYQCSPYHGDSALYPTSQQLVLAAGFSDDDTPEMKLGKLEALIRHGDEEVARVAPLLAGLLGLGEVAEARYGTLELTPQQRRMETLEALVRQLVGLAQVKPVLFVLEDAHWIDPTTLELIELCLDRVPPVRVMMLITARPTFDDGFAGHPIVTRLALNRLGREQTKGIVERITGGKALPPELLEVITLKTDGVPLFVEELTKTIMESGQLRESDGAYLLEGQLDRLAIPSSLHDSLMARLDRMQPVKEVAQTAACVGREFSYQLLAAISPLPETELSQSLDQLVKAELIFRRGSPPHSSYTFKHALVRDAAYESLLKSKRQDMHARLVATLEQARDTAPELLAHHATEAALFEKAIGWWRQAGGAAIARSAYQEAIGHLNNAIRLVGLMTPPENWRRRELELQVELGQALIASQGYGAPATGAAFARAKTLAEQLGDTPLLFPAIFGEWVGRYIRAEPTAEIVAQFLEATDRSSDSGARLVALRTLALERFHGGEIKGMLEIVEQILALYDPACHRGLRLHYGHDPRVTTLSYKSWSLCALGFPDQAEVASQAAISWAEELDHSNTTGMALCWGGMICSVMQRRSARVEDLASQVLPLSDAYAMPQWRSWSRAFLGWALAQRGESQAGLKEMEAGLSESQKTGTMRLRPLLFGLMAEALLIDGQHDAARAKSAEAVREMERTGDVGWAAELYRIRAITCSRGADARPDLAEAELRKSMTTAQAQQARLFELRAARDLAALWAERGERQAATELLRPLYEHFTEGFESPDLVSARTLLEEIS